MKTQGYVQVVLLEFHMEKTDSKISWNYFLMLVNIQGSNGAFPGQQIKQRIRYQRKFLYFQDNK